jgi:hypothetical protein
MPENHVKGLAGQSAHASRKPSQSSPDLVQIGDHKLGSHPSTKYDNPDLLHGGEQPKNDRRKRGDLDKRGLR